MLISLSAKQKVTDYLWYKFGGIRTVRFDNAHKSYDLEIDAKDKFGIKFGKKNFYLVHADDTDILFKLKPADARKIISKSIGFSGKIGKVKVSPGLHGKDNPGGIDKTKAPIHSTPIQQSNAGEDKDLTKTFQKIRFPGLKKIEYILTQRPVPGEVYQYYDVTASLLAYRRKNRIPVTEKGAWAYDLEAIVEKTINGIDVEIGYVKHKGETKQVMVVVEVE